jgi:hypothetical protein
VLHRISGDGVLGYTHNASGGPRSGGAFQFVRNAVINHGVRYVALFGYSNGASCVRLLTRLMAADPVFASTTVIWTGYIDAVEVAYNPGSNDCDGLQNPEKKFPLLTKRHFNVYQKSSILLYEPDGAAMDPTPQGVILQRNYRIDANDAASVYHWHKPPEQPGIEVHQTVQDDMFGMFIDAVINETGV